jgi:2-oxoglutarate/2-oxoacid ferredoxin oxidoreductase subunit alpha
LIVSGNIDKLKNNTFSKNRIHFMASLFIEGNEALAYGALAAGCGFFAGYPITPATSVFNMMLKLLPPKGGICLQAEDEIASMGFCIGASMAGWKVLTATSGPGISLCSEQISFAIGSEIPLVIINVQRLGPSTGSATRGADGDIQFLQWGNSGGLPGIVLAPVDAADCYILTMHAFNLAELYRCPVFIASNKEIGITRESIDPDSLQKPEIINRKGPLEGGPYRPFHVANGQKVPGFLPMGGQIPVRQTSSTHGQDGYITTDISEIAENLERLRTKLDDVPQKYNFHQYYEADNSHTLLITYGITARAAMECFFQGEKRGYGFSLLILKTLWPVPEQLIVQKAEKAKNVIVAEMNLGLYVREIERVLAGKKVEFLGRMDGMLITPEQIRRILARIQG